MQRVAVIDIGKTNVKVVVLSAATGQELACLRQPNRTIADGAFPHFDTEGIWAFICGALSALARSPGFDALSLTSHGAAGALLDVKGELVFPIMDYEFLHPPAIDAAYDALRPDFEETCSPRLPGGLNLGATIHYLRTVFPDAFSRVATILTYPQYWAFRLTGVLANEVTSLGCHTDLWNPEAGRFSSLVSRLDLDHLMAPLRSAFDVLGPARPDMARMLGIDPSLPVFCGIHDSNASLLPHLLRRPGHFAVLSTGTWIISFAVGASMARLDPARDVLANVDVYNRPVPSGRYMGGREFEILTAGTTPPAAPEHERALRRILQRDVMLLPNLVSGSGPLIGRQHRWIGSPQDDGERHAAATLYTACMAGTSIACLNGAGPVIVEGPFARNDLFLRMLSSFTGRPVLVDDGATPTGTAEGAALLTGIRPPAVENREIVEHDPDLADYGERFRIRVSADL